MAPEDTLLLYDACTDRMYITNYVQRTDEEWRDILTPAVFHVAREGGTEPPFSGRYVSCHTDGVYGCACCGTHLFFSGDKFDSGTGWPSFSQPACEDNIELQEDQSFGLSLIHI